MIQAHTKQKAVVTGGAGFIGSHLVDELFQRGYQVTVVDNLIASTRERVPEAATFFRVDVRDAAALLGACDGANVIFHLAALPRVEDSIQRPVETHEVNVTGTLNVLTAAKALGVKRIVLASSAAVYGNTQAAMLTEDLPASPTSPYGLHKYASEQYLSLFSSLYGLSTISLRFFNVYGPRLDPDGPYALVVGRFLKLRKEGKPLTIVGDGKQTRDFVHVRDVVRGLISAAESPHLDQSETINIGTGHGTSVNELADLLGGEREYLPPRIEPRTSCADIFRAKALLGWEPAIALADGIAEMKKEWGIA